VMPQEGPWTTELRIVLDTSIARARQLANTAKTRRPLVDPDEISPVSVRI
jgi:hypothetical protein